MGRYLGMGGKMGKCPDWYAHLQAAKYLNVAPWELMKQSVYWCDKAFIAMAAEDTGRKIQEQHK